MSFPIIPGTGSLSRRKMLGVGAAGITALNLPSAPVAQSYADSNAQSYAGSWIDIPSIASGTAVNLKAGVASSQVTRQDPTFPIAATFIGSAYQFQTVAADSVMDMRLQFASTVNYFRLIVTDYADSGSTETLQFAWWPNFDMTGTARNVTLPNQNGTYYYNLPSGARSFGVYYTGSTSDLSASVQISVADSFV